MGRTGQWLKSLLTWKKEKQKGKCTSSRNQNSSATPDISPTTPIPVTRTTPKEKRRWSFSISSASATPKKELKSIEQVIASTPPTSVEDEQKKHAIAVAVATEEAAAVKIQSVFRSYLARKALNALRGIVKLQALVRGHLVRKHAADTLLCMQALITAQARARAQRIQMGEEAKTLSQRKSPHRRSTPDHRFMHPNVETDRGVDEHIKIVEMDNGDSKPNLKGRNSYSHQPLAERFVEHGFSTHHSSNRTFLEQDTYHVSPTPSALTEMSPRTCSGHFEDYYFGTAQSMPQYYSEIAFARPEYAEAVSYDDYPFFPNYMAKTESSRAKVRSQSAPKSRPDSFERQPSRRRASVEGRNIPRAMRMQRSSSHVGLTAQNYQYPWSIKPDRSLMSIKDSECGSTSTVLTNTNYCRSLVAYDVSVD